MRCIEQPLTGALSMLGAQIAALLLELGGVGNDNP
jgi:hypothetical protein